MRLRNIYVTCRENIASIDNISGNQLTGNNSGYYHVTGWENAVKVIYDELLSIEFLREKALLLVNYVPDIYRTMDSFKVTNSEWSRIAAAKKRLSESMSDVVALYESMGLVSEETLGMDIKLPQCNDFSDLRKCLDDLEFIFYKCPLFKHESESLVFKTVDVGSMWLTFAIVGATVLTASVILNNVAAFIDKCIIIRSHKLSMEQQKIQLESMEMEKKAKQELLNGLDLIYRAQVEDAIKELASATNVKLEDGEEIGRAAQALEKMNVLLDKGMQINSTIESPKEVKALFAPLEMKYISANNVTKLLETKNDEQ